MISVAYAALFGLTCSGITALCVSLAWYRPLHQARLDAADLADTVIDEVAAHAATRAAHAKCCQDLRRAGINGAARRHLHSV